MRWLVTLECKITPISRFGMIQMGAGAQVAQFSEKPKSDGWMSAGYFVLNRAIFDLIDSDDCILERGPLSRLAEEGQLMAFHHEGFFYAMDTYREYEVLNNLWANNQAPWKVWE